MAKMIWALPILLIAQPASADDFALARRAASCFNVGPQDMGTGAEATILVNLAADGLPTDIDVLRYTPDSDDGRRLAILAAKAVLACGPYPVGVVGTVITMGPDVAYPSPDDTLITLPDRADGLDDSLGEEMLRIINGN